jgi:hypothetical protein
MAEYHTSKSRRFWPDNELLQLKESNVLTCQDVLGGLTSIFYVAFVMYCSPRFWPGVVLLRWKQMKHEEERRQITTFQRF